MDKIKVAVLGASGIVGQVFLYLLTDHKWFKTAFITASESRAEGYYYEQVKWHLPFDMPEQVSCLKFSKLDFNAIAKSGARVIFSALPAEIAKEIEPALKTKGFYVFSNASAMRYDDDVPILIPDVNLDSINLIKKQGFPKGGFVVTNPNCSVAGLAVALAPLKKYNIERIHLSTYQSISGAGYPGISALDICGNAIPFIKDEEKKIITEMRKIMNIDADILPFCVRIPTTVGHLESVWIKFKKDLSEDEIINTWSNHKIEIDIPSSPAKSIIFSPAEDFPQPKMAFFGNPAGMPVFTGRMRKSSGETGFILLVNNLVKGAAGGSIQNAECFVKLFREHI